MKELDVKAETEQLRDALRVVIAHCAEWASIPRGLEMILVDCRKLVDRT